MPNPFEAPKKPAAQEEEGHDVDLSDFAEYKENKEFGAGIKDFTPAELDKNFDAESRKLAPQRERLAAQLEAVADAYFASSGLLQLKFGGDPAAKARFRDGLMEIVSRKGRDYGFMDEETGQIDIEGLRGDERFWKKDMYEYAEAFVSKEAERKRRAA